jgi:BirA family biotin operon repressor/biotin-[acetyl-CoA-carboxylase] ligase
MPGADSLQTALQARLHGRLLALRPGLRLQVLASVDSTNTRLLEQARATPAGQAAEPCLLVALQQTAGRGRLGRAWQSAPGASLTFSLGLPLAPRSWSGLSLAVGLALAEALDPPPDLAAAPRIGLKWPNDLWLWEGPGRGRKLGGILIETVAAAQQRVCVIGVGLNIAPQAAPGVSSGLACLHELDGGQSPALTAEAALLRVAVPLLQAVLKFETQGFAPLAAAYARRDLLLGQTLLAVGAGEGQGGDLSGVAEGVDADGALCLRVDGARRRIVSGEVSVRLQTEAARC